jgi:alpha-ketoglutarate-dependent taurine dioxygenase
MAVLDQYYRSLNITRLDPFGLLVQPPAAPGAGTGLTRLPPTALARWAGSSRVVVLRGFDPLPQQELVSYCHRWGELLEWDFGAVLDLIVHDEPQNYLFTRGPVPLHWDGAFARQVPSYMFFQCVQAPAPGSGGETTFCDTAAVWQRAGAALRARWEKVEVCYRTDKVAHYGGEITSPLACAHPLTRERTLRYAEPLDPAAFQNPVSLTLTGVADSARQDFLTEIRDHLYQPDVLYAHAWRDGDYVVADNHAVLHGRNAFTAGSPRHLRRVHIA